MDREQIRQIIREEIKAVLVDLRDTLTSTDVSEFSGGDCVGAVQDALYDVAQRMDTRITHTNER